MNRLLAKLALEFFARPTPEKQLRLTVENPAQAQLFLTTLTTKTFAERWRRLVVVLPDLKTANHWLDFCQASLAHRWSEKTLLFPHFRLWGTERLADHAPARTARINALSSLATGEPFILVTTIAGLLSTTVSADRVLEHQVEIQKGRTYHFDDLVERLKTIGYREEELVERHGTFSLRGGVIDVYPSNCAQPVRVEFFGDQVAAIREFAADSQRSLATREKLSIAPIDELVPSRLSGAEQAQILRETLLEAEVPEEDVVRLCRLFLGGVKFAGLEIFYPCLRDTNAPLIDSLTAEDLFFFPLGLEKSLLAYQDFLELQDELFTNDREHHRPTLEPGRHFPSAAEAKDRLRSIRMRIAVGDILESGDASALALKADAFPVAAPTKKGVEGFESWMARIHHVAKEDAGQVLLLVTQKSQEDRFEKIFSGRHLEARVTDETLGSLMEREFQRGIFVGIGQLDQALWFDAHKTLIIPEHILFGGSKKPARSAPERLKAHLQSLQQLKINDLVVHIDHGIGRYTGITKLDIAGISSDFLILLYALGDKIYVPVDKLSLVQLYRSEEGAVGQVALDHLRTDHFRKRKSRARESVEELAQYLLALHAKRSLVETHVYAPPGDEYYQFEAEFRYEETPDQLRAIEEIHNDLSLPQPMDRLVCGDVGFGKTEVALRGAYRVVLDGFQVMVLVPTTVLCFQHAQTFSARLAGHGVRIGQVNRFVNSQTIRQTLEDFAKGHLDILVGTHRLLSTDVKPKRLGLLVIDEEHRFGVTHKEKLKELGSGCHVLTLTATPIPRTLNMALLGLREISIIASPPPERLAVRVYVSVFDEQVIREAMERELRRQGQIFFVHNRVEDIHEVAGMVQRFVPGATVGVAHGQMAERKLEETIIAFVEQKFSILICTTIIESGIDIPNVNTLIVNQADRFGLAQLYQLKGRVGRSDRQAFAYFLTDHENFTDEARRRLDVIGAYQELGAGFHIANRDLELRGTGDLLGPQQSGHISDIGYELYMQMLKDAIDQERGQIPERTLEPEIKLDLKVQIPENYISSESLRLQLYRKLYSVRVRDELVDLEKETEDRFGAVPFEVRLLFAVGELKMVLRSGSILELRMNAPQGILAIFSPLREHQIKRVIEFCSQQPNTYRLLPNFQLRIRVKLPDMTKKEAQLKFTVNCIELLTPVVTQVEGPDEA